MRFVYGSMGSIVVAFRWSVLSRAVAVALNLELQSLVRR